MKGSKATGLILAWGKWPHPPQCLPLVLLGTTNKASTEKTKLLLVFHFESSSKLKEGGSGRKTTSLSLLRDAIPQGNYPAWLQEGFSSDEVGQPFAVNEDTQQKPQQSTDRHNDFPHQQV